MIMITSSKPKPSRNRVDMSTTHSARQWRKRLNKPAEEIEAAVAKVGNNAETVMRKSSETRLLGLIAGAARQCALAFAAAGSYAISLL